MCIYIFYNEVRFHFEVNGVKVLFIVSVFIILSASVSGSIYNVISMLLVDIAHINTSSIELLVFM